MFLLALVALGQGAGDGFRRVILPPPLGHCPFHHGADALAHPGRRFGLGGPDRGQNGQHVRRSNLPDLDLAQPGEGVGFESR